jgi:hypothetical protein
VNIALISLIHFHSRVFHKELPLLASATALAAWQIWDGHISCFVANRRGRNRLIY